MAKRSEISGERLNLLRREGAVYVISCGVPDCTCEQIDQRCERGFFSLFIQVVYGIHFAWRLQVPYHVDFGNANYCYIDHQAGKGANFWNYYFKQPLPQLDENLTPRVINVMYEVYPLRIWDRSFLTEMYESVVSRLEFQPVVEARLAEQRNRFKGKKILGVQIRCTDHALEVAPLPLYRYQKSIARIINDYDHVFIATDDHRILAPLKEAFGQKLLYNDVVRSNNEQPVHRSTSNPNRYQLGVDVLLDCYSLSLCKHALLIHSNISYAALLFNPYLSYTLLETGHMRVKKWKTMLAFYLNKWGIRKW